MLRIKEEELRRLSSSGVPLEIYVYLLHLMDPRIASQYVFVQAIKDTSDMLGYSKNDTLTEKGMDLIKSIQSIRSTTMTDDKFEKWWNTFPASDKIGIFPATRRLRTAKEECYDIYLRLINSGYTHEEIMKGLQNELLYRRSNVTDKNNPFQYMRASNTWLNKRTFLEYLDDDTELPNCDIIQ